jgi:hypothetical protein
MKGPDGLLTQTEFIHVVVDWSLESSVLNATRNFECQEIKKLFGHIDKRARFLLD